MDRSLPTAREGDNIAKGAVEESQFAQNIRGYLAYNLGGLGSYTLSLLLIAFFRVREVEPVVLSQVFEGFASFLKSFLTEKWQIDPEGDLPILKEHPFKEPYLKHPYDGHNLLAKCYRFNLAVEAIGSWKTLCSLP